MICHKKDILKFVKVLLNFLLRLLKNVEKWYNMIYRTL